MIGKSIHKSILISLIVIGLDAINVPTQASTVSGNTNTNNSFKDKFAYGKESSQQEEMRKDVKGFLEYVRNNNIEMVKKYIKAGMDVNATYKNSERALILAFPHKYLVKFLLEHGADANFKNKYGQTALMWATLNNELDIVQLLLAYGAKIDAQDKDGATALIWAAEYRDKRYTDFNNYVNNIDIVQALIVHEADINVKDKDGRTALMWAADRGYQDTVSLLVDHKANVNMRDKHGRTALMFSSIEGHKDIVKLLLMHGAKVNAKDDKGNTALFGASLAGNTDIIRLLIKYGANNKIKQQISTMIYIPAGWFWMGCSPHDTQCRSGEKPYHRVYLDAYYIDKNDITVLEYTKCVNAGVCSKLETNNDCNQIINDRDDHPINCIDPESAKLYCTWLGERLPTEAEWEKAARGVDGRIYPWGNKFDCNKSCNSVSPCKHKHTCEVGTYTSGASPYGVNDMSGNVNNWVSDLFSYNYYSNSPEHNPQELNNESDNGMPIQVFRGGSWDEEDPADLRTSLRGEFMYGHWFINNVSDFGFRCVQDASVNLSASTISDTPQAPDNLTQTTTYNPTTVTLNWERSKYWEQSQLATGYRIYMTLGTFKGQKFTCSNNWIFTGSTTNTHYIINKGLNNITAYCFAITAVNNTGESGYSAVTSTSILPPPDGLVASTRYKGAYITWTALAGAIGYNIYTSTTPGNYSIKPAAKTTSTYFTCTGLRNYTRYYFVVTAVYGIGESGYSNEDNAITGIKTYIVGRGPQNIAIDASNNIWITNTWSDYVTVLSPSGTTIGIYNVGIEPSGIAIDHSGNVWVTNEGSVSNEGNTISEITTSLIGKTYIVGSVPRNIAIDASGNIWVTNAFAATVSEVTIAGTSKTYSVGSNPAAIAIDKIGNIWVTNWGNGSSITGTISEIAATSLCVRTYTVSSMPGGIAVNKSGNVWVTNAGTATISEITPEGIGKTYNIGSYSGAVAIDATGNIWVLNNTLTELSPTGIIKGTYAVGTDSSSMAIDASGNIWVTNWRDDTVTEYVGIAKGPQYFPYTGPQWP